MTLWKVLGAAVPALSKPARPRTIRDKPKVLSRGMSMEDVFAHYHETAPREDVRFALRVGTDLGDLEGPWLRLLEAIESEQLTNRREIYEQLHELQTRWRIWRRTRERAEAAQVGDLARRFVRTLRLPAPPKAQKRRTA